MTNHRATYQRPTRTLTHRLQAVRARLPHVIQDAARWVTLALLAVLLVAVVYVLMTGCGVLLAPFAGYQLPTI